MGSGGRLQIHSEQRILIGRPSDASSDAIKLALVHVIDRLPRCFEAHYPQYFAVGAMQGPRKVLVLVVHDDEDQEVFGQKARAKLLECLPELERDLDIWVMVERDPLLSAVRKAECLICRS